MKTHAKGRGTVKVTSFINGQHYQFLLTNVLYVPTNTHNLLSLGRWDTAGGNYHRGQGILTMCASNGDTVAVGTKLSNNLYRLQDFKVSKPETTNSINRTYAFQNNTNLATWEIWHRHFGHLGLTSLQALINQNMVTGLNIDQASPKYDCEACTKSKQFVNPFPTGNLKVSTQPGQLTHTDLWGKYPVQSIHGHQYFHSFLDDSTQRPTICFLKTKDEAAQALRDYVTYLEARGFRPQAFHCDEGREFVTNALKTWLHSKGIKLQTTAPYSPSQNGAAERLNRTLST